MKTVITYGTFDLFHVGHLRMLRRARELGDRLIVGVSTDEFTLEKGKKAVFSFSDRVEIVSAIRYVDDVFAESTWEQKVADIHKYSADILVMGDDWTGKFDFLNTVCQVVYLPRTEGISTSGLKDLIAAL
jgi:glycerol-3-phosphate cytidylyltransferase